MRSVVLFLSAKDLNTFDIHSEISVVYDDKCMCKAQITNWVAKSKLGITQIADFPGQARKLVTPANTLDVNALMGGNRRISISETAIELSISHSSLFNNIHDDLAY